MITSEPIAPKTAGRFRFFPQLNDQEYTDWMHSTDRMTQKTTDLHFTSDTCLLYTSPSPRDRQKSRMPSSA